MRKGLRVGVRLWGCESPWSLGNNPADRDISILLATGTFESKWLSDRSRNAPQQQHPFPHPWVSSCSFPLPGPRWSHSAEAMTELPGQGKPWAFVSQKRALRWLQ